ncbi:MAG: TIGR01777 family oxidoreductase [Bacteroidia bacterium]
MKYLVTGGTGLVGRRLINGLLADGHEVHNLGRGKQSSSTSGLHHHQWDGRKVPDSVPPVDVVVNLAGASIGKRWNPSYKELLVSSRVDATKACVEFLKSKPQPGQVLLSASGFNYYGDLLEAPVDEASPAGDGFMSQICKAWEAAAQGSGARTVTMRISVVLDKEDGPLAKMLTPYKFFIGGPVGSGRQGFPWIHLDDLVAAIRFLAENSNISGPVNLVSPQAIQQKAFAKALGKAMGRPSLFRLPKWILQLVFGEMSVVLWGGAFVDPKVLKNNGFTWKFPEIDGALRELLRR